MEAKTIGWRSWILGGGGPCRSPHKSGPFRQGFGGLRAGPERGPASPTWPPPSGQHHHRAPYTMAQPSPLSSSEARVLEKGPGSDQKPMQKNVGSQFCLGFGPPCPPHGHPRQTAIHQRSSRWGHQPKKKKEGGHKRDQDLTKNNYRPTLDPRIVS